MLVARDGQDVADHMQALTSERARAIGEAARLRILADHTYALRAQEADALFTGLVAARRERSAA